MGNYINFTSINLISAMKVVPHFASSKVLYSHMYTYSKRRMQVNRSPVLFVLVRILC